MTEGRLVGFLTLRKSKIKHKNSFRNLFSSFSKELKKRPISSSFPSLILRNNETETVRANDSLETTQFEAESFTRIKSESETESDFERLKRKTFVTENSTDVNFRKLELELSTAESQVNDTLENGGIETNNHCQNIETFTIPEIVLNDTGTEMSFEVTNNINPLNTHQEIETGTKNLETQKIKYATFESSTTQKLESSEPHKSKMIESKEHVTSEIQKSKNFESEKSSDSYSSLSSYSTDRDTVSLRSQTPCSLTEISERPNIQRPPSDQDRVDTVNFTLPKKSTKKSRRISFMKTFTSKKGSKSEVNIPECAYQYSVDESRLNSSTQAIPENVEDEISTDKRMAIGRKKFNIDPKRGIEYLTDNGLINYDPNGVAQFLFNSEGLNKSQIGLYLGEYREFNLQTLNAFIQLQDFTGLDILIALRQFLWTFHPPGEAQKIERILDGFSSRYCQLNPSIFPDPKGCFTLSFCIVILNTLLHNPNVKEKPPFKVFVEMVNLDQNLPEVMIQEIFESILNEPLRKDDGDELMHTFFNPDREGWLWKQGGRYKSWKRRWFIMTGKCLYYFEYTTDKEFRGIIPLENIRVREVEDRRMSNCFEIFNDNNNIVKACKTSNGKVVEGRHKVYRISATSNEEMRQWMDAIRKSTMFNPLYKLLGEIK